MSQSQLQPSSGSAGQGKKILGPSLDEIGSQLRSYASDRITKIVERVNSKNLNRETLNAVPHAFALRFFQSASMSEDDDLLTDLWANLLIKSAQSFDSRKILYLDILDKISPQDACVLSEIIPDKECRSELSLNIELDHLRRYFSNRAIEIIRSRGLEYFDQDGADQFNEEIALRAYNWPTRVLHSDVPFELTPIEGATGVADRSVGLANSLGPYDPLIRQRLIQQFEVDFIVGKQIRVGGVMATDLGIEFMQSCRGEVP